MIYGLSPSSSSPDGAVASELCDEVSSVADDAADADAADADDDEADDDAEVDDDAEKAEDKEDDDEEAGGSDAIAASKRIVMLPVLLSWFSC